MRPLNAPRAGTQRAALPRVPAQTARQRPRRHASSSRRARAKDEHRVAARPLHSGRGGPCRAKPYPACLTPRPGRSQRRPPVRGHGCRRRWTAQCPRGPHEQDRAPLHGLAEQSRSGDLRCPSRRTHAIAGLLQEACRKILALPFARLKINGMQPLQVAIHMAQPHCRRDSFYLPGATGRQALALPSVFSDTRDHINGWYWPVRAA